MGRKPAELNEKHWKAIKLIEEGRTSLKEIAKQIGMTEDCLYKLNQGNVEKMGQVAALFKAEVDKIHKTQDRKIKHLTKANKVKTLVQMAKVLDDLENYKNLTLDEKKIIATYHNALAKSTPNVEIGSVSWSYTKGMTPQELIYEFERLKSLAEGSSDRRGLS